jgi:hypothetical protein
VDWDKKLNADEKQFISSTLAFFAAIVNENLATRFMREEIDLLPDLVDWVKKLKCINCKFPLYVFDAIFYFSFIPDLDNLQTSKCN